MLTISAGHYGKGTGASGLIDEGEQAIYVVKELEKRFKLSMIPTQVIIDNQSTNQRQNLAYLVSEHNRTERNLDVSIHFNAVEGTRKDGIGTEVLYINPNVSELAGKLSTSIAQAAGFKNRGAKLRTNLAFLNGTTKPALLIEICFVNSETDVRLYQMHQAKICDAIFTTIQNYLRPALPTVPTVPTSSTIISHPALLQKVQALFNDKQAVRKQLEKGIEIGAFQSIWLEKFDQGILSFTDYLALTTLQYKTQLK